MLSQTLVRASRSPVLRRGLTAFGPTRAVAHRFVAGDTLDEAVAAVTALAAAGLMATVDVLGEDTTDRDRAAATADAYVQLLGRLGDTGLGTGAEVSVKLSALGQGLGPDGTRIALDNARTVCRAAARAGTTVTLDMEDHTTVDSTLQVLHALREDHPWTGAVLQSALHRTLADAKDLARPGSRVRLVKGAYAEPASVAHQRREDVSQAYADCLDVLFAGGAHPMVATHDLALVDHAVAAAARHGFMPSAWEVQMLLGIRQDEQRRLAAEGRRVRVYVPFGTDWYPYFMRRLAERPANLTFFLRALVGR